MNPVPVLRITDTLADGYALWARSVASRPSAGGNTGQSFQVEDHMGRHWRLQVDDGAGARYDVIGTFSGRRRQPQPSLRGEYSLRRWGLRWTLFAVAEPELAEQALVEDGLPPLAITVADSQALDRVGAWLAQPAGLAGAGDALGAGFLEVWQRTHASTARWHAALERAHDGLRCVRAGPAPGPQAEQGRLEHAWLCGRDALHELVDLQRLLLGPRALAQPQRLRERGLRRLSELLEVQLPQLAEQG